MKRLFSILIIFVILVPAGEIGYSLFNAYSGTITIQETARSILSQRVREKRIKSIPLPRPPKIWPDTDSEVTKAVLTLAGELNIPLTSDNIAIWQEKGAVHFRFAWSKELTLFSFPVTSILFDKTLSVPLQ